MRQRHGNPPARRARRPRLRVRQDRSLRRPLAASRPVYAIPLPRLLAKKAVTRTEAARRLAGPTSVARPRTNGRQPEARPRKRRTTLHPLAFLDRTGDALWKGVVERFLEVERASLGPCASEPVRTEG